MKKIKRYTKEEALNIINKNEELKQELTETYEIVNDIKEKPIDRCSEIEDKHFVIVKQDLDLVTGKLLSDKYIVEWFNGLVAKMANDDYYMEHIERVIVDSLEEAVVIAYTIAKSRERYEADVPQEPKPIRRYTKKEARKVMSQRIGLKYQYNRLKDMCAAGELNHSFMYGNFFNLCYDELDENGEYKVDPEKVVIQWCTERDMKEPEDFATKEEFDEWEYSYLSHRDLVCDSLEEALVVMADIEDNRGLMYVV